jgi:hypothetical protein
MQAFGFFFQLILVFLFGSHDFLTPAFFPHCLTMFSQRQAFGLSGFLLPF